VNEVSYAGGRDIVPRLVAGAQEERGRG
jgi:hypothetical protein